MGKKKKHKKEPVWYDIYAPTEQELIELGFHYIKNRSMWMHVWQHAITFESDICEDWHFCINGKAIWPKKRKHLEMIVDMFEYKSGYWK